MSVALWRAVRFTNTDYPVLITGETGTGKEMIASAIHRNGKRSHKPFVSVNSAALPQALVEDVLFGHERGAFTGAHKRTNGKFHLAHEGTLFLDEVGEMPLETQAKLLRVLETGMVCRVGGETEDLVTVRLICATNRILADEVKAGRFRQDLFYRLHVLHVHLPPLRERPGDIPQIAWRLLASIGKRMGRTLDIADDAMLRLVAHDWPGNVRELDNVLIRAAHISDGPILQVHLGDLVRSDHEPSKRAFGDSVETCAAVPELAVDYQYTDEFLANAEGRKAAPYLYSSIQATTSHEDVVKVLHQRLIRLCQCKPGHHQHKYSAVVTSMTVAYLESILKITAADAAALFERAKQGTPFIPQWQKAGDCEQ